MEQVLGTTPSGPGSSMSDRLPDRRRRHVFIPRAMDSAGIAEAASASSAAWRPGPRPCRALEFVQRTGTEWRSEPRRTRSSVRFAGAMARESRTAAALNRWRRARPGRSP